MTVLLSFSNLNVAICIAAPLLLMLFVQPDKKSRYLVMFLLFGLAVAVASGYLNQMVAKVFDSSDLGTALYIAPIVEEILKALPIIVFFFIKKPTALRIISTGIAVGVGFATLENINYLYVNGSYDFIFILIRGFSTGIMHSMTVSLLAAALAFVSSSRVTLLIGFAGALSVSVVLHGTFNLFVNGNGLWIYAGYLLPLFIAFIFLAAIYRMKKEKLLNLKNS